PSPLDPLKGKSARNFNSGRVAVPPLGGKGVAAGSLYMRLKPAVCHTPEQIDLESCILPTEKVTRLGFGLKRRNKFQLDIV
ncbi:MAG TPA: hypothetical protein VI603_00730, partial [Saprospiraceae bacterium]|nr:hypothetical protein [Saprospiraceae bacterium]